MAAVAAAALVIGSGGGASAAPPDPDPLPNGWSVQDGKLTWTSAKPVPMGDAAVEFWSGDKLLGRAAPGDDKRSFRIPAPSTLSDLQVRAGGRRLDVARPKARRAAAAPARPAPAPAWSVDPGVPGPEQTISGDYDLPGVKLPDFGAKVEMLAHVVAPRHAAGPRPLALFLHGRHYTCYNGPDENQITGDWPCPAGTKPVPSYLGYLKAQQLLASQGYVTVSISANGINGQDYAAEDAGAQARSSLIRLHLADWADWAGAGRAHAPAIVKAVPRADLSKVFLMGHSRGGEGVNRAVMDSVNPPPAAADAYHGKVRWTIRGTLLIGPTIFGHDPEPDVPSATILPGCDGDVSDLEGQMYTDATRGVSQGKALHSALYVLGANHNYFNSEWTPGLAAAPASDDFSGENDPLCTPGTPTRLTPEQEQTVGATYIAAAARLFVGGDDRVLPLLDGSGVRMPSADPARVYSAALGANRSPVIVPDTSLGLTGATLCQQIPAGDDPGCLPAGDFGSPSPHFVPFNGYAPEPGRYAVTSTGTTPAVLTPPRPVRVAGATALEMRLIVPPNTTGHRFSVAATDSHGRRVTLGEARLDGLPGTENTAPYWGQDVRVPLPRGLDSIASVELTRTAGTGPAWLLDAWGWRPGTPRSKPVALPRIDIGTITVAEGDSGSRTYQVPVDVKGRGTGTIRVFVTDPKTFTTTSFLAGVRPGTRRIDVPVSVVGNTRYGGNESYSVAAKAVRNTLIGDWIGGADVREDDPIPTVTITPAAATATEGHDLTWNLSLSDSADNYLYVLFVPQAPAAGPELSTTDVDPEWFRDNSGEEPEPSRPLSGTAVQLYALFEPGTTTARITIPTVADGVAEGAEHVQFQVLLYPPDFSDPTVVGTVTGTVTD